MGKTFPTLRTERESPCAKASCRKFGNLLFWCSLVEERPDARAVNLIWNDSCLDFNGDGPISQLSLSSKERKSGYHSIRPETVHRRRGIPPHGNLLGSPPQLGTKQAGRFADSRRRSCQRRGREVAVFGFGAHDCKRPLSALPTLARAVWTFVRDPSATFVFVRSASKCTLSCAARRYTCL